MNKKLKFEELGLSNETLKAVVDLGFEEASPIQSQAIPVILKGEDIIGQAMTGTGKTAAYGIPLIEKIDINNRQPQALVLCPTRELAIQVTVELNKFAKYKKNIFITPIYGGQSIEKQFSSLKRGVNIVVGTPGRVLDHLYRGTFKTDSIKMVVLDEADEILDMGFRDDLEDILSKMPKNRQTITFSATMSNQILNIIKKHQKDTKVIKVAHDPVTVPTIEQSYFQVDSRSKVDLLTTLLDLYTPKSSIVFCNTQVKVDELVNNLKMMGYHSDGIHGGISQAKRNSIMDRFRNKNIEVLVATDVAARGIDVPFVEIVFNYDIPQDEDSYVHRIGRTGRAGQSGKAFSFVSGREFSEFRDIKRYVKTDILEQNISNIQKQAKEIKANKLIQDIKSVILADQLQDQINIIDMIMKEDHTAITIAAALLKMLDKKNNRQRKIIEKVEQSSFRERDDRNFRQMRRRRR